MTIKNIVVNKGDIYSKYATQNKKWIQLVISNEELKAIEEMQEGEYINIKIEG